MKRAITKWATWVLQHPRLVLAISCLLVAIAAVGLTRLVKDVSMEAFIPPDHASVVARQTIEEEFGIRDALAVSLVTRDGSSVFAPSTLARLRALTREIEALPGVDRYRVASLATESSILGAEGALEVESYIADGELSAAQAEDARRRWRAMPPHQGTLVARDESGALILLQPVDADQTDAVYAALRELARRYRDDDIIIDVAGPAAVSAHLSQRIDADARVLQPFVFVIVLAFVYAAFRRGAALVGPLVVIVMGAVGSLGLMGWMGVPYFAITGALPVIVIAIAIADSVHLLSEYYAARAREPARPAAELVLGAVLTLWRPIVLTTVTTMAGFLGIYQTAVMPPISWFALFAGLGVGIAGLASLSTLPALLALQRPAPSPAFPAEGADRTGTVAALATWTGRFAATHYLGVFAAAMVATFILFQQASGIRFDRSQVENFSPGEPIRVADERINRVFDGTATVDILITSSEAEGFLTRDAMHKVHALQAYAESLPHVSQVVGITDYLVLLQRALDAGTTGAGSALPTSDEAVAQYLLLYESSAPPGELEEEITASYDSVLLRGILDTVLFSESRQTVEQLRDYIDRHFSTGPLHAELSGTVGMTYHWMSSLSRTHFASALVSLALILAIAVLAFRSPGMGLLAVFPVALSILAIHAAMALAGLYIEPATSMFAAIAIGVGIDFSIHLIDRIRSALGAVGGDLDAALQQALPLTARACFFSLAALGVGFTVLCLSEIPTLRRFGALVALATGVSFIATLLVVPAGFGVRHALGTRARKLVRLGSSALVIAMIVGSLALPGTVFAQDEAGRRIAEAVDQRPESQAGQRLLHMTMIDKRGNVKEREAILLKRLEPATRKLRITFTAPKGVRDSSFLSYTARDDAGLEGRWIYLPAARKVRRVPAAQRGSAFMGTDFSYADIQSGLKLDLDDHLFESRGESTTDRGPADRIAARVVDEAAARELGYTRLEAVIDRTTRIPLQIEFYDGERHTKSIEVLAIDRIGGFWTALELMATDHGRQHTTRFRFSEIRYPPELPLHLFKADRLAWPMNLEALP